MRRILLIVSASALSLWLLAAPATAAEKAEGAAASAASFDGVVAALIGGVILGVLAFMDARVSKGDGAVHH